MPPLDAIGDVSPIRVVIGDSRRMDTEPDGSVDLVITSPPYWHIKDTDAPGKSGRGSPCMSASELCTRHGQSASASFGRAAACASTSVTSSLARPSTDATR